MSNKRDFLYSESDSETDDEELARRNRGDSQRNRDETSSDSSESDGSDESSDDEGVRYSNRMRNQVSSDEESSNEDEKDHREDEIEQIQGKLNSLKEYYDQQIQEKLHDIESKKNAELEEFRRQEKVFKEEIEELRAERSADVEAIEELRRELEGQRLTFEHTLENILENQGN